MDILRILLVATTAALTLIACEDATTQSGAPSTQTATAPAPTTIAVKSGRQGRAELGPKPAAEAITFQSADYADYAALYRQAQKRELTLTGDLFMPPAKSGPVPAVILMHASGGRKANHEAWWVKEFNGAGFAVLAVDYFGPRRLSPPVSVRDLSYASVVADIYGALRKLAVDSRIDANRIAVVGFSRGAEAARQAAFEPFRRGALGGDNLRLAAHIALYPLCVTSADGDGAFTGAPVLILGGDADDGTPVVNCRETISYFGTVAPGAPLRLVAYPGATHGWDDPGAPGGYVAAAPSSKKCTPLLLDSEGKIAAMVKDGRRVALDPQILRCAGSGATMKFDPGARQRAGDDVLAFLRSALKL